MTNFVVSGSGTLNLSDQVFTGFVGLTYATDGNLTVILKSTQFDLLALPTDSNFVGSGFRDTLDISIKAGTTFVGSSFSFATWGDNDRVIFHDASAGNENITGTQANDTFNITGGVDSVDGNLGTSDLLVVNWGFLTDAVNSSGNSFTTFNTTSVSYTNIDRFDLTLGSGNDNVTTGSGYDVVRGGGGNDSLNTGQGKAEVFGGSGFDLWGADFSLEAGPKTIDITLTGTQLAGNGTTYNSIERLSVTGGSGADIFTTRTSNANDGLNDTLNGGAGNDILTVGGGTDTVDGGADDDLLIIDFSTDTDNFNMAGSNTVITDFSNTNVTFANIERFDVRLGAGNDNIVLGAGADKINGGGGNDSLNTGSGAAIVDGANGNDLWIADFSGDATVKTIDLNLTGLQAAGNGSTYVNIERLGFSGGSGADIITTRTSNANDGLNDTLNGGAGNDILTVGGGTDTVDGGADDDLLIIDFSTDTGNFNMAGSNTVITDFSNTNVTFANIERFDVRLGSGNDNIVLGAGSDKASGGAGDDSLNTGAGAAIVDGGTGKDLWIANFSDDATVKTIDLNLGGVQVAGNGSTYVRIERLGFTGGVGADVITTRTSNANDGLSDTLNGGAGNDILTVGGGSDTVDGGADDDLLVIDYSTDTANFNMAGSNTVITDFSNTSVTFTGIERFDVRLGSGNDNIVLGAGSDKASGGAGNDSLNTGSGAAFVDGGIGNDLWIADFSGDTTVKTVDLNLSGQQNAGNGSSYVRIERLGFTGGSGNDVITTRTGSPNDGLTDTVNGGEGNDIITVGGGNDTVDGGIGNDLLVVDYSSDADNFNMAGSNTVITDFSNTSVTLSGIERFDVKTGTGSDSIVLGAGNDKLNTGDGTDTLTGGGGRDVLTGGDGNDTFVYLDITDSTATGAGPDTITDFDILGDRINLQAIDAVLGGGDDAFILIGNAGFSALGQVRVYDDGINTFIEANTRGGLAPDMQIVLKGVLVLDVNDFVL